MVKNDVQVLLILRCFKRLSSRVIENVHVLGLISGWEARMDSRVVMLVLQLHLEQQEHYRGVSMYFEDSRSE